MKYQIRKRENVTIYLASKVAELDDEDFRNLESDPYTGNTEKEFLKYISNLDLYEASRNGLDSDVESELEKILDSAEMEEFGSSAEKFGDIWFESGEADEKYHRYGGFNPNEDTKDNDSY